MIYVLSGGTGKAFAVIGVTYPEGSTCTCTDGTKTLKLKDTSGQGIFLIPYAAMWTVTCTDGTNTNSESVEITAEGQSASVKLSYTLYLFKNGDQCVDVTGGWERNTAFYAIEQNKDGTVTFGNDLYFWTQSAGSIVINTKNSVDISQYNTLNAELTEILEKCRIGVKSVKSGDIVGGDNAKTTKTGVVSFDISSYTGKFWIVIGAQTYTGARIPRVWLS